MRMSRAGLALALLTILPAGWAMAQEAAESGSPVNVGSRTLFRVSTGVGAFTPRERAEAIEKRIAAAAAAKSIPLTAIQVHERGADSDVLAGETVLMSVTEADAKEAGKPRQQLAESYAAAIRTSIAGFRREHTARATIRGIGLAGLATLLALLIVTLLNRLQKAVAKRLAPERVREIRIQEAVLLERARLAGLARGALRLVHVAALAILSYWYLYAVLVSFPETQQHAQLLLSYVSEAVYSGLLKIGDVVPNLVTIAIIVVVAYYAVRFLGVLFDRMRDGTLSLLNIDSDLAGPTFKITRFFVLALTLVAIYPYIPGSNTSAFKGLSLFLGAVFSLGSGGMVANLISGLIITYMRPFRPGDRVRIDNTAGTLTACNFLVTKIRTVKNVDVTISNAAVLAAHITNYAVTDAKPVALHTNVTIGYDTPWRQVEALLTRAAGRTEEILSDPAPFVLVQALEDWYVRYELNAYTLNPWIMERIYSELHKNVLDEFNEYGVQIMSPNYIADPQHPAVVPKDRWYAAPARKPVAEAGGEPASGI